MPPHIGQSVNTVAKVLGIELRPNVRRRDDAPALSDDSTDSLTHENTYTDYEPSVVDWFKDNAPTAQSTRRYFVRLFPFAGWLSRYDLRWLLGDLIAGITVGAVVIPQGMAYASLAALPPQFGLYSSFMGVLVYWLFATSKDITIGPVAVMSTITGNVVLKVQKTDPSLEGHVVASALALIAGCIILFIGLIRYGWIVEFISLAAIAAFMTGSAISIAVGQVPTLMGISGFSSRDATYKVIINILKHLGRTSRNDAAIGISALVMLYLIRFACHRGWAKFPTQRKVFNLIATTRVVFVILLYTLISWLVNRGQPRGHSLFKVLGAVPHGFQNAGVPKVTIPIIKTFASQLPATVIVLWIEHIAIAKAFGRVNHYTIDPSQEMVAIGLTNVLGPFLGAYPTTGSFSRTAINAKAGVNTPLGGLVSATLVLLGIYALSAAFYYIPNATMSAVIIHAVCDLITTPDTLYQFWKVSPFEVLIFFVGVIVTIFSTIEIGIYTTISLSLALLLFRFAKANGSFLGKVKVHTVVGDRVLPEHGEIGSSKLSEKQLAARNVFLPINYQDGTSSEIRIDAPYPGIFIYRFSDGFNYPNATCYLDNLLVMIYRSTRPGRVAALESNKERTWSNLRLPQRIEEAIHSTRPELGAIILDFSAVNNIDITAVQQLIDVRNQLDRWAAPETPEWHIANINNKWTRRALVHAGFGYPTPDSPHYHRWKPVFSVADIGANDSAATAAQMAEIEQHQRRKVLLSQSREREQQRQRQKSPGTERSSTTVGRNSFAGTGKGGSGGGPHIRLSSVDEDRDRPRKHRDSDPEHGGISVRMTIAQQTIVNQQQQQNPAPLPQDINQGHDHDPPPHHHHHHHHRAESDIEKHPRDPNSPLYGTSSQAFGAKPVPKVTLVNGLDKPLFHVVEGVSRPLFHVGLSSALQSAVHNLGLKREIRRAREREGGDVEGGSGSGESENPGAGGEWA